MYQQKIIVQDRMGRHYRLQLCCSPALGVAVRAENFSDESFARHFISKLNVTDEGWRKILQQANDGASSHQSTHECLQTIAGLLVRGAIKVYKLDHLNSAGRKVDYPAITTQQREQYRFMPVSAVLAGDVRDIKRFQRDPKQASAFIEQLNLRDAQLEDVLKSLGLATGAGTQPL